jgi:hypothetical protein
MTGGVYTKHKGVDLTGKFRIPVQQGWVQLQTAVGRWLPALVNVKRQQVLIRRLLNDQKAKSQLFLIQKL